MAYVIGIDVGTGGVRGALVSNEGKVIKVHSTDIKTWNPKPDFYQQSSTEIWSVCCNIMKQLTADIGPQNVKGLGFDATCSLVALDAEGNPISVNVGDDDEQDIMLWMDHRAQKEADFINKTNHPVLRYVGGKVSLEMMIPKILWLKNNHPECWKKAQYLFLLPDYLTWKCTDNDCRSLCSVVSKYNYEANTKYLGWNKDYFDLIGLSELSSDNWKKIGGSKIIKPGELCGGITAKASKQTGLTVGTPVAAALIDAHAGALGVIGCVADEKNFDFTSRLPVICGTSTCHMAQTADEILVPGIWGPHFHAIIPDLWTLEGGQSVSGKLIHHIIETHPAGETVKNKCPNMHVTQYLNNVLCEMAKEKKLNSVDELTKEIHIWPDFHGNRSPIADPSLTGMIHGLTLVHDEQDLAVQYLATVQALAYGTKHIIDAMYHSGHKNIESLIIAGGLSRNELFLNTHANAIGLQILIPKEPESVLLGAGILGAVAAGFYDDFKKTVLNMAGPAKIVTPDPNTKSYHEKKYQVFLEMLSHQIRCKAIMNS